MDILDKIVIVSLLRRGKDLVEGLAAAETNRKSNMRPSVFFMDGSCPQISLPLLVHQS